MSDEGTAAELEALRAEIVELRRRLEFAQCAVDALPFPIFWKDRDSIYVGANREQASRSGFPSGEYVVGLSDTDLPWTPEQAEAFRADDRRVMTSGVPVSPIVETQRLLDKGERLCETHKSPLVDAQGHVIGVVGWYEDVTEREEQRREQQLLDERLLRAHKQDSLGTLAGGIAHDFNNILASIMANLWLVQAALPTDHPATESLEDIQRAGLRAKRLVEQLTQLKQRQPQKLGPVSLGAVALDASRLIRAMLPAGVELTTQLDPTTPTVLADAGQLHQVVINLCTNAWLAIQDRPTSAPRIELEVSARELDSAMVAKLPGELTPGVHVVLSVSDNGVGMDVATQRRIFEPFFTTREVGAGTGLGLSVVQGIVAAHGGAVEAESTPGCGTTLRVFFPQSSELAPQSVTPSRRLSSRPPTGEKHVLYVDDDLAVLRAAARLLGREGCRTTVFSDPREAADALRKQPCEFDLLAVDFSMPHLSGLDLARIAGEVSPELPVILVSGYVTADLRREAESLGVVRVLNKVDVATELWDTVRGLLALDR